MSETSAQSEQFTGLILLTGIDRPGIAASLFETLAPFALQLMDIEQVVINNRLILTVLVGANPAHQGAIEEDLNACAAAIDVDIATIFSKGFLAPVRQVLVEVIVSAQKLHPRSVALITQSITLTGANIERIVRSNVDPVSLTITISGVSKEAIDLALSSISFADPINLVVSTIE